MQAVESGTKAQKVDSRFDDFWNGRKFAERILETRVRIGLPSGINNLVEDISGPAFTSCTGMLLHSILMQENEIKNKTKNHNFAMKFIEKIMGSGF